jgi:hypothetical protein
VPLPLPLPQSQQPSQQPRIASPFIDDDR